MNESKLRWGILGTANIARKNWMAIRNTGNSIVTAVASRDPERSRRFVAECQGAAPFETAPTALGSYEELLASTEVNAVYIPLPTGLRKKWVLRAAEAGKHIVCEKPCANSVADLREMLDACHRHRVQFIDGVMFMHSRRLDRLREVLNDGESVGHVKRITSAFSFSGGPGFLTDNIRVNSDLEPFGCLGDLGWYCIRLALWVMNEQLPRRVTGRILSELGSPESPGSVPGEFSGELLFDGGVSAGFYCSFLAENQQWANISGTRGYVRVPDFVLPFFGNESTFDVLNSVFRIEGCDFNMEPGRRRIVVPEYSNSHTTAQETNLFRNFADQVQTRHINSSWPKIALNTQRVLCACLESARADSRAVAVG